MALQRWTLLGLLGVAGLAFWLLVAGPATLLGVDTGNAGMALLVTAAWTSLSAISRTGCSGRAIS